MDRNYSLNPKDYFRLLEVISMDGAKVIRVCSTDMGRMHIFDVKDCGVVFEAHEAALRSGSASEGYMSVVGAESNVEKLVRDYIPNVAPGVTLSEIKRP